MNLRISIIGFLLLATHLGLAAQPTTHIFATRDGWGELKLDVYRPTKPRPDKACVIAVFGGGFVDGSRDNKLQTAIANQLIERGFTVVNIDYRLGLRDSTMVAQNKSLLKLHKLFQYSIDIAVEDCADAIHWVCENANNLDIDTSKIILTGSSAGAITVLQLDYSRCNSLPTTSALPTGWRPAAVVPYSGAIQCRNSKLHYAITPAPTLFMHGTKDKIVAYRRLRSSFNTSLFGSVKIAAEFKKRSYPFWLLRYDGIGHEVASFLPGSVDIFCAFVNQALDHRIHSLDASVTDAYLRPTEWTKMNLFDLYK